MEKSTNFETLGAHMRNLLSPYSTLIQMLDEIYNGEDDVSVNHIKNYLLTKLNIDNLKDNLKNFIDVSKLSEVEKINWRATDLYKATVGESQSSVTDDNDYCRENCKGFQETGKCFADGRCKSYQENKMNENNVNYTNIEQSKKLFALGADVNAADMLYVDGEVRGLSIRKLPSLTISDIPAWSIGSLIKLMTRSGENFKIDYTCGLNNPYSVVWKSRDTNRVLNRKDLFTAVFDMVCLLLQEHLI